MKDFLVQMKTRDGCLIQNRKDDRDLWIQKRHYRGKVVEITLDSFAEICLTRDCCEKGVKLVSYTYDENGIYAIVEWC